MSDRWNEWNEQGGPKYPHERVVQFVFRNYGEIERRVAHALDLGCGSGVHTVFLAAEGFRVTGVDASPAGIANTRRKLEQQGLSANLRVEGAEALVVDPASVDLVICVGMFDSAGPAVAGACLRRLGPSLKPRGKGLFLFASDRDFQVTGANPYGLYGFTRLEVEELFASGFREVWIDRYITTYENGRIEQNDWLVTLE